MTVVKELIFFFYLLAFGALCIQGFMTALASKFSLFGLVYLGVCFLGAIALGVFLLVGKALLGGSE